MDDARGVRVISSLVHDRFRRRLWSPVVNSAPAYRPDRQVCIALNGHPSLTSDLRDAGEPRFFKRIVTRSRVYTRASRRYLRNTRGQGEVRPEAAFADWSAPSSS